MPKSNGEIEGALNKGNALIEKSDKMLSELLSMLDKIQKEENGASPAAVGENGEQSKITEVLTADALDNMKGGLESDREEEEEDEDDDDDRPLDSLYATAGHTAYNSDGDEELGDLIGEGSLSGEVVFSAREGTLLV